VERLDELVRKLKREIEHWQDEPPEWIIRTIRRTLATNSNLGLHPEQEHLVDQRFKSLAQALSRLEHDVEALGETMTDYVKRHDYDKDLLDRSEELSAIREQIATSNGLLRGIMSALGYIDKKR
jgi:enamine deaminase RidA (YjgF/YER057c/UK114 family)